MTKTYAMLIDGEWVAAESGKTLDVFNPATDEVIAKVPDAGSGDVDRAVQAARRAFDGGWRDVIPEAPVSLAGAEGSPFLFLALDLVGRSVRCARLAETAS